MKKSIFYITLLSFVTLTLSSCGKQNPSGGSNPSSDGETSDTSGGEQDVYEIKFVNYDNTPLSTVNVKKGEMPVYSGETPVRTADERYTYTFSGWTPEIVPAVANATYTATYSEVAKTFTVRWFNGTELLETDPDVPYGSMPSYDGEEPSRPGSAALTYEFTGWDPAITPVTGDVDYYAQFEEIVTTFTVTYHTQTEQVIPSEEVEYGKTATKPEDPYKEPYEAVEYIFQYWYLLNDESTAYDFSTPVYSDLDLYAKWTEGVRHCTVTFNTFGADTIIPDQVLEYGQCATKPTQEPVHSPDDYLYEFDCWYLDDEDVEYDFSTPVYENITINAKYFLTTNLGVVRPIDCASWSVFNLQIAIDLERNIPTGQYSPLEQDNINLYRNGVRVNRRTNFPADIMNLYENAAHIEFNCSWLSFIYSGSWNVGDGFMDGDVIVLEGLFMGTDGDATSYIFNIERTEIVLIKDAIDNHFHTYPLVDHVDVTELANNEFDNSVNFYAEPVNNIGVYDKETGADGFRTLHANNVRVIREGQFYNIGRENDGDSCSALTLKDDETYLFNLDFAATSMDLELIGGKFNDGDIVSIQGYFYCDVTNDAVLLSSFNLLINVDGENMSCEVTDFYLPENGEVVIRNTSSSTASVQNAEIKAPSSVEYGIISQGYGTNEDCMVVEGNANPGAMVITLPATNFSRYLTVGQLTMTFGVKNKEEPIYFGSGSNRVLLGTSGSADSLEYMFGFTLVITQSGATVTNNVTNETQSITLSSDIINGLAGLTFSGGDVSIYRRYAFTNMVWENI